MMVYKILFVEDDQQLIESLKSTVNRIRREDLLEFKIEFANSVNKAVELLSTEIDYVIIDIKLDGEETGDVLVDKLTREYRIPAYVVSGTPEKIDSPYITVYKKGEKEYGSLLKDIAQEIDTGLFKVIGNRGIIEESMNNFFWERLYKNIELWKKISSERNSGETEKIILRYTLAHLQELLDQEIVTYEPLEMYIQSQKTDLNQFKTGEVVYNIDKKKYYIVLSPACDLVLRNGRPKVDNIILVEILDADVIFKEKTEVILQKKKKKRVIEDLLKNNFSNNLYWLPENSFYPEFKGGFIDFRNVFPTQYDDLVSNEFELKFKLQENFVKNVLSQFSVYYGRQGQPDFNFSKLTQDIIDKVGSYPDVEHS
ncbi:hypothetical protein QE521_08585 [Streptococcus suis]|uniref:hypothetical protein n=1 Tax=Streptococcus suis TaxID=1307 RepID=UPI0037575175